MEGDEGAMTDDEQRAISAMNKATIDLSKALPTANGGLKNEGAYGVAYQRLVQLGLASQLRRKYRG
jgi:hypothetical protein